MANATAAETTAADQKLSRLAKLARSAGQALWERVSLAAELLADLDWVIEAHAGDEGRARDKLEARYFPDLFGSMDLNRLLEIRRMIPNEVDWKVLHYNLTALWAKAKSLRDAARGKGEKPAPTRVSKRDLQERDEKITHLSHSLKRETEAAQSKDERIASLEARCLELERENAHLRGRLEELERLLPDAPAA